MAHKIPIVITSINNQSKALTAYDNMPDFDLILVGDRKGPSKSPLVNGTFLSLKTQKKLDFQSIKFIPENHYSRKNIGYLHAISNGAKIIFETDDDNLPKKNFPVKALTNEPTEIVSSSSRYLNIYKLFTTELIWPRGYPLSFINQIENYEFKKKDFEVGIWQGLADGDPDVDAIHRFIFSNKDIKFSSGAYVLDKYLYCPFNSQNTFWYEPAFPFLYLPCFVSFRFTDILRSYVTQKLLWNFDLHLGFHEPTVYQDRNQHDLRKDFRDEITMYTQTENLVSTLDALDISGLSKLGALKKIYVELEKVGITKREETECVNSWISDLSLLGYK